MDFFNSKSVHAAQSNPEGGVESAFSQAINERFSSVNASSLLTSKLTPAMPLQTPMLPSSAGSRFGSRTAVPRLPPLVQGVISGPAPPLAIPPSRPMPVSTSASSSTAFPAYIALYPSQASAIVGSHDILLVDIRSHSVFRTSRIRGAVSLVVPSTLLKRPGYPLEKMAATIDDASARERFEAWQTAKRIVVYDVDTSQLNEGSNVTGLLRKFQLAGFTGELCWIKGGFNAVQQTTPSLVDTAPPEDYVSESDTSASSDVPLRARNLSMYAFQQASTTLAGQRTPKGNQSGMSSVSAANPFYDNIRQNLELSQGVDTRIALRLPQRVIDRRGDLPFQWLRQVVDQAVTDSVGDALAMQFYRIELNEQRRLQEVMDHHSKESATAVVDDPTPKQEFPYSITAGIEMGTKNRYRNIWPFEHARVRLQKASKSGGSDYVNASFVQSLVSRRRYIATQGPLDSTYDDFWSICWEQNVTVIVMLTREVESSLVKCGHYWKDGNYGDISIQLISQQGEDEQVDPKKQQSGAYFNTSTDEPMNDTIIERIFQLRHKDHPRSSRKLTHLQYLGWPDLDVPSSPSGLLALIKRVTKATEESASQQPNVKAGPVLLHCSAGVGRTGGFILVDSILDGIRHELIRRHFPNKAHSPDEMDLDSAESVQSSARSYPSNTHSHSALTPISSNSGSESALPTTAGGHSSSSWSKESIAGTSPASKPSLLAAPKPKKLSHIVADKLTRATYRPAAEASRNANVVEWSKGLLGSSSDVQAATTPYFNSPYMSDSPLSRTSATPKSGVNYKAPRRPVDGSPPFPSSFAEPIRQVLEDMREQRMSLCQSLRQYVFAHRAILEGALDIVDEMRAANPEAFISSNNVVASERNEMAWSSTSSLSSITDQPIQPSTSPTRAKAGRLSSSEARTMPTGKRTASAMKSSPGESRLGKRPSSRRKHNPSPPHSETSSRESFSGHFTLEGGSLSRK